MWPLIRCRHPREMFDRYEDGRPGLRCQDCLHLRPNILYSAEPQVRLTQVGGPVRLAAPARGGTGIERWAELDNRPITDLELFGVQ